MGNVNNTAEIFYIPIFLVSMTEKMFITPSYNKMFPLLEPDNVRAAAIWRTLHPGHPSPPCQPGEWPSLPHELQTIISAQLVVNTRGQGRDLVCWKDVSEHRRPVGVVDPCQKPEEGGGEPGVLDLGGQNPGLGQLGHGGWGQPPVSCHPADGQFTRSLHRCSV